MIGEILTWGGVGVVALFTYLLYRSAERSSTTEPAKPVAAKTASKQKEPA